MNKVSILFVCLFLFVSSAYAGHIDRFPGPNGYQYEVYSPDHPAARPALILMLHGCTQTPAQLLTQTQMAEEAERKGLYLVLPQQPSSANMLSCWNWFEPATQTRDISGESEFILTTLEKVIVEKNIDRSKVGILGFSAGAIMTTNLVSCFPELFRAALIHSGMEFAAAGSMMEAFQVMRTGPLRSVEKSASMALACAGPNQSIVPVYIVQGSADSTVGPVNFGRLQKQFTLVDAKIAASRGGRGEIQKEEKIISDTQLFTQLTEIRVDGQSVVKAYFIKGMQHAWSGGSAMTTYSEPRGLPISQLFVDEFFSSDK